MKYVIYDFNGTVVDDVDISIECLNKCIEKYLDREPIEREEYLHIFTFPVKEYYEKAGFDFNILNWEEVGQYWMDYYVANRKRCNVHEGVVEFLKQNREAGNKNVLLSASKIDNLKEQIKELGVIEYFDEVLGIDNIYASSKIPIALEFIKDKNKEDCVMIGDSLHDLEVSRQMGIRGVLVAKGHQAKEKLLKECDEVYDDIREVIV